MGAHTEVCINYMEYDSKINNELQPAALPTIVAWNGFSISGHFILSLHHDKF